MQAAYIFIGQSGAGKGTQAALLRETLASIGIEPFSIETGAKFRELIVRKDNYTAARTRELMDQGKLPPSFLGVHMWAHQMIESYDGLRPIIIDGTPRVAAEVPLLLSTIEFYGWKAHVIFISVGDEWAHTRTVGRGRADDKNEQEVWGRIQWFHESVMPAVELLKASPLIHFHNVHGEQTIEEVHNDVCHTLGL